MKWIILLFLFYNSVASSTPATPGPGWIGCVFTPPPHTPCHYTRTMKCKTLFLKDDVTSLGNLVERTLFDALDNLARLSEQYMRYDEAPQNSSIASCNVGNI